MTTYQVDNEIERRVTMLEEDFCKAMKTACLGCQLDTAKALFELAAQRIRFRMAYPGPDGNINEAFDV